MNYDIRYQREFDVTPTEFTEVLKKSTLAERRPIEDAEKMFKMCKYGNLTVTARLYTGELVGIARSFSDFAYTTYLADLAVDVAYQRLGIGKRLIWETFQHAPDTKIILLAAPAAVDYYPKIGFKNHPHCYILENPMDFAP